MRTILLVDDDKIVRDTFALALTRSGHQVVSAGSGPEALTLARQYLPDLILCDINMPGMDGRAVLKAVREDPDLAARQFVLMTGNTLDTNARRGMELGADDFLAKPITLDDLQRCVSARLKRAQVHWRVEDRMVEDLRGRLHRLLPHEFFTPLNSVLGLVQVLRDDLQNLQPNQVQELLDAIDDSGWRLHRTLRNYLLLIDAAEPIGAAEGATPVIEGERLTSAVHSGLAAASRRSRREADLQVNLEARQVLGTPTTLALIVEELVDNAFSFSRRGTPVRVSLTTDGALSVTDQGRGMTAAQLAQIGAFQQFERKKYEQQGLGLGLFLVQKCAGRYGATLRVESEFGRGTSATVQFRTG